MKKHKVSEKEKLKEQIDECLGYMKALSSGFNETSGDELVSSYIYEKRAAELKYRYLLGLYLKATEIH